MWSGRGGEWEGCGGGGVWRGRGGEWEGWGVGGVWSGRVGSGRGDNLMEVHPLYEAMTCIKITAIPHSIYHKVR